MTTVFIRARPATMDDLQDGQVLLLPIWDEHGQGHQVVAVYLYTSLKRQYYLVGNDQKRHLLPDFFPENCYVPAP